MIHTGTQADKKASMVQYRPTASIYPGHGRLASINPPPPLKPLGDWLVHDSK